MVEPPLTEDVIVLARDLQRELKYLMDLGLTDYGDDPPALPRVEARSQEPGVRSQEPAASSQESGVRSQESAARSQESGAMIHGSRLTVHDPRITPAKKKTLPPIGQASLFGELGPAPPAVQPDVEQPVDETLDAIRADIGDCTRCKLHATRTHIVFGEGNPRAELMFIGEGPGADEDATGRPFVGRAGQLLDRMIEAIGMKREDCYIANIVKCRPPGNREPEPDEVATCEPFLYRQIAVIKPRLVVALGATAATTLLGKKIPISKIRGQFLEFRGTKLLPTFHPAFLLRSPGMKKEAWEDLKKVRDFLHGKISG
ncbi:MAG: uracil-DNA glycosylase [Acidobacteriota bacterium]|nr:uracil-DNA glycosylase [Blastocatellia bacterium]MDW8238589.1 uracil-DNA glycosylase [Acidobacteriota bacterium]